MSHLPFYAVFLLVLRRLCDFWAFLRRPKYESLTASPVNCDVRLGHSGSFNVVGPRGSRNVERCLIYLSARQTLLIHLILFLSLRWFEAPR
jgi:hypothetical protein